MVATLVDTEIFETLVTQAIEENTRRYRKYHTYPDYGVLDIKTALSKIEDKNTAFGFLDGWMESEIEHPDSVTHGDPDKTCNKICKEVLSWINSRYQYPMTKVLRVRWEAYLKEFFGLEKVWRDR